MGILKKILILLRFFNEIFQDGVRYIYAIRLASSEQDLARRLEAKIIREIHVVEKGLSMADFKPKFGRERILLLQDLLKKYKKLDSNKSINAFAIFPMAKCVLLEYKKRHEALSIDLGNLISFSDDINEFENMSGTSSIVKMDEEDKKNFERISKTRRSVRFFLKDKRLSLEAIKELASLANTAPSVCNRQTAKLHLYEGVMAQKVLRLQSGNRGFGHQIEQLVVVTSDLRLFFGPNERYQAWIDGGLFAMQFMNAAHASGYGCVPLNWGVSNSVDKALRKVADIPEYERIIMIIAIGYADLACTSPMSVRRSVDELLHVH